ncbi:hypothetical protein NBRC111894_4439 [Sporolactobacillus inulinus]|uniref:Uncharacterized protein n=1 Tax=Sporolactobacillus inulinus TaxID=2078 RepID=A0A4Y1ZIH1_9BACL|nr:hypothetical protein NBRC111894_4439 [Sporolactobacillus inulinus]
MNLIDKMQETSWSLNQKCFCIIMKSMGFLAYFVDVGKRLR